MQTYLFYAGRLVLGLHLKNVSRCTGNTPLIKTANICFLQQGNLNIPHLCSGFLISGTISQTSVPATDDDLVKTAQSAKWSFNMVEFMIRGRLSSAASHKQKLSLINKICNNQPK